MTKVNGIDDINEYARKAVEIASRESVFNKMGMLDDFKNKTDEARRVLSQKIGGVTHGDPLGQNNPWDRIDKGPPEFQEKSESEKREDVLLRNSDARTVDLLKTMAYAKDMTIHEVIAQLVEAEVERMSPDIFSERIHSSTSRVAVKKARTYKPVYADPLAQENWDDEDELDEMPF